MPRLHCRVRHDPTLKLTVTWLKDDAPLYFGNRSVFNGLGGCSAGTIRLLQTVSGVTRDNTDQQRVPI